MTGMRIKSHKNAFGTHNGSTRLNRWNPGTAKTFWEGLQATKPAVKTAALVVVPPQATTKSKGALKVHKIASSPKGSSQRQARSKTRK